MVVSDCIAFFKYVEKENTIAGPSALNLCGKKKKKNVRTDSAVQRDTG